MIEQLRQENLSLDLEKNDLSVKNSQYELSIGNLQVDVENKLFEIENLK